MNKKELYKKYLDFEYRASRGFYWLNIPQKFVPVSQTVQQVAMWKIVLWNYGVPTWLIATIVLTKFYLETYIIPYFIGRWDEKKGYWKFNSEYTQKKEHLAPFNVETAKTLENIARAVGAKSEFKDIQ